MHLSRWLFVRCVRVCVVLVQEATAAPRRAVAVQLALLVLDGELVVVGELFSTVDASRGEDDDVLLAVHSDDPGVAVGLTGMVDEAGGVAMHSGIHHLIVIDAEHVTANPLGGKKNRGLRFYE